MNSSSHSNSKQLSKIGSQKTEKKEWTREENKKFEKTLAELGLGCDNLLEQIAARIPGKSTEEIKEHYEALLKDVEAIDSGKLDNLTL